MWLSDSYEVPQELIDNPPSPEFRQFLLNWFGSNRVGSTERVRSATCLVPEVLTLARELMRRNLTTRRHSRHMDFGRYGSDSPPA
jgi:hypothetical protein